MERALVAVAEHEIPTRAPLRLAVGDTVEVGARDTTWPAFVFVTAETGEGWVPERHLSAERPRAVAIHPYDTTELPVAEGEPVTGLVEDAPSAWTWCRNAQGREGWVPSAVLRPAGDPAPGQPS